MTAKKHVATIITRGHIDFGAGLPKIGEAHGKKIAESFKDDAEIMSTTTTQSQADGYLLLVTILIQQTYED